MSAPTPHEFSTADRAVMRREWEAWRTVGAIVTQHDGEAGVHHSGCECGAWGCKLYNAVRAWGEAEARRVWMEKGGDDLLAFAKAYLEDSELRCGLENTARAAIARAEGVR